MIFVLCQGYSIIEEEALSIVNSEIYFFNYCFVFFLLFILLWQYIVSTPFIYTDDPIMFFFIVGYSIGVIIISLLWAEITENKVPF